MKHHAATIGTAATLLTGLFTGCAATQSSERHSNLKIEDQAEPTASTPNTPSPSRTLALDNEAWQILAELDATPKPSDAQQPPAPISLVAGDWLAFQCAYAGGYLDQTHQRNTPVYAEVFQSWIMLD